jgi:23S rRNA (guanosine2251-2'-O)-methyltransferase
MALKKSMPELERKSPVEMHGTARTPVVVVLDNVRSLSNVGSIFRTADAFALEEIHLCGMTGTPPNREINKTALGATDSVSWRYFEHTIHSIEQLKREGYSVIGIEQVHGSLPPSALHSIESVRFAVVFGNEVHGIADEVLNLCDFQVEIPQSGTKHSLNVSVCAGIILWELYRRMKQL